MNRRDYRAHVAWSESIRAERVAGVQRHPVRHERHPPAVRACERRTAWARLRLLAAAVLP